MKQVTQIFLECESSTLTMRIWKYQSTLCIALIIKRRSLYLLQNYMLPLKVLSTNFLQKCINFVTATRLEPFSQISLASLPKWLSVRLWTKWSWGRVQLQSLKIPSKESLDIQATIECQFTLKRVRDMIRTCSH